MVQRRSSQGWWEPDRQMLEEEYADQPYDSDEDSNNYRVADWQTSGGPVIVSAYSKIK